MSKSIARSFSSGYNEKINKALTGTANFIRKQIYKVLATIRPQIMTEEFNKKTAAGGDPNFYADHVSHCHPCISGPSANEYYEIG